MAITGNPGDLATGGFGTGVRGVAATPRDVANAVSRGEAMASARMGGGGQGNNRAGPLSVYGNEFTFTDEELKNAALSNAGLLFGTPQNPTVKMLMDIKKQTDASPKLQGVLNAIQAPFKAGYQAPSGLLDSAVSTAMAPSGSFQGFGLPEIDLSSPITSPNPDARYNELYSSLPSVAPLMGVAPTDKLAAYMGSQTMPYGPRVGTVPSQTVMPQSGMSFTGGLLGTPSVAPQQDMGPLSNAAVSAALGYQNTPLENDIAYLASRVGPNASPEALALVEPRFVTELAKEIRAAEAATNTTAIINDLYRSPETQGQLYAEKKAIDPNYMVAPAGRSLHQGAFSADIARSPVLDYMRANTPASLNFPYDERDLVHVQLSDPEIKALGYKMTPKGVDKTPFGAFTSTMGDDGGLMFAGGDFGQMAPVQVAAAPSPAPVQNVNSPSGMAFNAGLLGTQSLAGTQPNAVNTASVSAPSQTVMAPGGMAFNAGLLAPQLLAGAQPQVVNAVSAPEAPPAVRPTGAPTRLASLLFDRALERARERGGEGRRDRRRKKPSTTTEQTMSDTIEGLLA